MSDAPITRVVIAGGGTAGWVAAAALVKQLGPLLSITLVESDEIGTVGVGESTIPTARTFHQLLGIYEDAFMRATQATFKLGIAFENWWQPGDRYIHPFGSVGRSVWAADFQHFWLEARHQGLKEPYGVFSLEHQAAEAGRFDPDHDPAPAHAYHIDATAYARFLRGLAEPAGVRRVEGKIAKAALDPASGAIEALELESGERIEGDLFLDCTGFRALLIGQALGVEFVDWSHWLATDRAMVVQTEATEPPVPYTRAIAHRAGWRWKIPLQARVGNGLVYSSDYMSDDAARALLLESIEGASLFEPRRLQFTSGMRRKHWARNCVALGLAGGFVEPLESTSIHLIHVAVTRLIQQFPFAGADTTSLAARFNAQSEREWEHVRDFIILHYRLTERDEPFWRRCRDMTIPDTLSDRITLFAETAMAYQGGEDLFRVDSWVSVMLGQGVRPEHWHRLASMMPPGELLGSLDALKRGIASAVARMPSHQAILSQYCAANDRARLR